MKSVAIGFLIVWSTACTTEVETTHHINEIGNFCLTVPSNFEERRIAIQGVSSPVGKDSYSLIEHEGKHPATLEIGVNSYEFPPENKITVEYVWELQLDGTLLQKDRQVTIPDGALTYPPVALSLFFGADHRTLYYFKMNLNDDGFEDLFIDIVGSFQSLR